MRNRLKLLLHCAVLSAVSGCGSTTLSAVSDAKNVPNVVKSSRHGDDDHRMVLGKGAEPLMPTVIDPATVEGVLEGQLSTVDVDKGLKVLLTVTNPKPYGVPIQYRSGKTADLWVVDSSGGRLWAWSDGMMFTQVIRDIVVGAGDEFTVAFTITAEQLTRFPKGCLLVAKYAGAATESSQVALADVILPLP
ncbi:hypothetical protein TUM3794_24740 [Shewanella colwelliana]|uniref:Intracellular proteinase inhibitor BsuPI domain-containing protein n=1 Tax=Shewanella colwelliana TaxID=23 RepID=A0ABQ4P3P5_SHECO|nr:BsuPI-related putative proteinase inhibitor [Shewanella colwelliana]GIU42132.1 hypothetical protein TUM3794_24740 [Shewanella colwelliana]